MCNTTMCGKFEGPCVPDPCVTRIVVSDEWLAEMKLRLPEMPGKKAERFIREYGLAHDEAALMSSERELSEYFEEVAKEEIAPRTATLHRSSKKWLLKLSRTIPAMQQ